MSYGLDLKMNYGSDLKMNYGSDLKSVTGPKAPMVLRGRKGHHLLSRL